MPTTKKRTAKVVKRQPKRPLFHEVNFSGVGMIETRGRKKVLAIYSSEKDALKRGVPQQIASEIFRGVIAAGGDCTEDFGIFGGVSCTNKSCAQDCTLQVNKLDGLGWNDVGSASATVNSNWAYRCRCK